MIHDPWLNRWLPLISEHANNDPVLEIGCGAGEDTSTLVAGGLKVVAFDRPAKAVKMAKNRVPSANILCQDVRAPFPIDKSGAGTVIASLSLHYFSWSETLTLVSRIHDVLRPNGLFVCRLNSTEDHNFGASGHPSIEDNYYMVNGEPKRFFDEPSLNMLFTDGWHRLSFEHFTTRKYFMNKALWEVVLEKKPNPSSNTDGCINPRRPVNSNVGRLCPPPTR